MKVRIGNCGDKDLIVKGSGGGTVAVPPLGFGGKISRDYMEFDIGDHELIVLHARGAKDPDGVEIKSPV